MSTISLPKTWVSGDVLTAADLNSQFTTITADYNGGITNANISVSAAIAYSKLNLTASILNADIGSGAAIAISKIATGISGSLVGTTDTQTLSNKTLTSPILNKPTVNASVPTLNTVSYSATPSVDLNVSNHHIITLTGNAIFSFTNASAGQMFILHVKQDGSGSRLASWPGTVQWAGGSTPALTSTAGKVDTFGFVYTGSVYYGYIIGKNV